VAEAGGAVSWLRTDDQFTEHPKFEGWSEAECWQWFRVMNYCARYETEGRIPSDLRLLPRSVTRNLLKKAEFSRLCDRHEDGSLWVHNWEKYNPKDSTKAARQARWRANRNGRVDDDVDGGNRLHVDGSRAGASGRGPSRPYVSKETSPQPPNVYTACRNWVTSPAFDPDTMGVEQADEEFGRIERRLLPKGGQPLTPDQREELLAQAAR
jgi:hypothetical protein